MSQRAVVVGARPLLVEAEVLILQRVRELVRERDLVEHARRRRGPRDHAQAPRARVVVAGDLLAEDR
jgi:hypothetical protein